ncbi:MAG: hypothetical protein J6V80_04555 [Clostridia bacterium]|nr:hypothetical protein [Clostridia bacterium]
MRKQQILALICLLLLLPCFILPASANSAQQHWTGTDASGAVITDGNSPIIVEGEVLTFDIAEFPSNHYYDAESFSAYTAKVTAEYTFYNPSDMTVTATLAFPLGHLPGYAYNFGDFNTDNYSITVGGEEVESRVRYTLSYSGKDFNLEEDLPMLSDEYLTDDFYTPDLRITAYKYEITDYDKNYSAANYGFDVSKNAGDGRVYYMPSQSGMHTQKDGDLRIHGWAKSTDSFVLYVFGNPLESEIEWTFYQNGGVEDDERIDGNISLVDTEVITLEEFALANYTEDSGISKVDWFNAVITELKASRESKDIPVLSLYGYDRNYSSQLLMWYQYEITLTPGERITNTVTAPMYPGINMSYVPTIYNYTYLISPASTWSEFGQLKIVINTPYFMTECNLDGFSKTDNGYELTLDGLPTNGNGKHLDLIFTMSTEENPVPRSQTPDGIVRGLIYLIAFGLPYLAIGIAVLVVGVVVIAISIAIFKKRRR